MPPHCTPDVIATAGALVDFMQENSAEYMSTTEEASSPWDTGLIPHALTNAEIATVASAIFALI
jgi:hypothetical protein